MPNKGIIIGIVFIILLTLIIVIIAIMTKSSNNATIVAPETPTTNNNGSDIPPGAVIQTPSTGSGVPSGRYVKISQNFVTCMNIAEIQVSSTVGGSNIAKGKTSTKSSGLNGDQFPVGNITDENLTNFSHTSCNDMPWMQVDLGSDVPIASISIINRTDCCQGRAIGSIVEIINAANTTVWKSNPLQGLNEEITPITPGIQVNTPGPKTWTLTPPNPDAVLG